jgi:hypothetical protein
MHPWMTSLYLRPRLEKQTACVFIQVWCDSQTQHRQFNEDDPKIANRVNSIQP